MPFTLTQLQAELQARGYSSDTSAAQTAAINAAIRDVRNYRNWPWDDAEVTATIAANVSFLTAFPATVVEPTEVRISYGTPVTEEYNLVYLQPDDLFDLLTTDTGVGVPEFWTWRNGNIYVYPTADREYTATIQHSGPADTLSLGGDTINLPDGFINPVLWGALTHLAYRERDWSAMAESNRMFHQTITRAAADLALAARGDASVVKRSGFYENYDYPGII